MSLDSLVTTIEAHRAALLQEVDAISSKDLKELRAQRDIMETAISGLKKTLSVANRSLQCSSDLEMLLLSTQVKSQLVELSENQWDPTSTNTIATAWQKYSIESLPGPGKLGQVKIMRDTDPPIITVPVSAQLGKQGTFEVRVVENPKQKDRELPQLEVKVLHGKRRVEIPLPPTVTPDPEKRSWSVRFTPVVSGVHSIRAKVNLGDGRVSEEAKAAIKVTGKPAIAAKVQRGPDWTWNYGIEDGGGGKWGTILPGGYNYRVRWDSNDSTLSYKWGRENRYDIQLAVEST